MLSEYTVYDQITILEDGQIQLRNARIIIDGDIELTRIYHREVIVPGDDISQKDQRIQDIANVVWTPEIIDKFNKAKKIREDAIIADIQERI